MGTDDGKRLQAATGHTHVDRANEEEEQWYDLVTAVGRWASANFGNTPVSNMRVTRSRPVAVGSLHVVIEVVDNCRVDLHWMAPLMGMMEELGELCSRCNADGEYSQDDPEVQDAIGDIGVYFCDYLYRRDVPRYPLLTLPGWPAWQPPPTGIVTALGRLYHTELKHAQAIRGMQDADVFRAAHQQACGYLWQALDHASFHLVPRNPNGIYQVTKGVFDAVVAKRDWKKHAEDGVGS